MFTRCALFKMLAAIGGGSLLPIDRPAGLYRRFRFKQAFPAFPPAPGKTAPSPFGSIPDLSIVEQWENLLDDLDGVELIGRYIPLTQSGDHSNGGKGPCPFCRHGPDSLLVDGRDDSYFCTDCLVGGHALDFHARIEGVDLVESVRLVRVFLESGQLRGKRLRLEALRGVMEETAALTYNALVRDREGRSALAWLARQGITEATIERFSLGMMSCAVGRRLMDHLLASGSDRKQFHDAGVTGWLDCREDQVRNGESDATILMPVRDGDGRCWGFYEQIVGETAELGGASSCLPYGFRLLSPHRADRLVFSAPSVSTQFEPSSSVILTEHPWDVLLLVHEGIEGAAYVAPLGMDVRHDRFGRFLARTSRAVWPIRCSNLTVEFLKEMAHLPSESMGRLAFMMLPEGTTLPELVRREGPHAVRHRFAEARPISELVGM